MNVILQTLSNSAKQISQGRPLVCLTWAQSLDGKLAATPGKPTLISGQESMEMTHALRAFHDAILVGVGTLIADNPRLSCRVTDETLKIISPHLLPSLAKEPGSNSNDDALYLDPIPIVLDSTLRMPRNAGCLSSQRRHQPSLKPIIFHELAISTGAHCPSKFEELKGLADLSPVPSTPRKDSGKSYLSLKHVLEELHNKGVRTLMVEGGAAVLSSFLETDMWDLAVVTVAPRLFRAGISLETHEVETHSVSTSVLERPVWTQMGDDVVVLGFRE